MKVYQIVNLTEKKLVNGIFNTPMLAISTLMEHQRFRDDVPIIENDLDYSGVISITWEGSEAYTTVEYTIREYPLNEWIEE